MGLKIKTPKNNFKKINNGIILIIVLAVILSVSVLSFFTTFQKPSGKFTGEVDIEILNCDETDYGRDPFTFGEVKVSKSGFVGETKKFVDYCESDDSLIEYYCITGKLTNDMVECSSYGEGWKCREGTCRE
ncbi:MAG: hypothetical protein ISS36_02950 [Candidatus Aenigmarchaeota archaeon]|nr:hypothetical protein [Candidatus Aenigmarchaeota archaeon]